MNSEERKVISDIFDRLRQAASQPRDPEAERFIAETLREQPYAPYARAQLVYVQAYESIRTDTRQKIDRLAGERQERDQGIRAFASTAA